MFVESLQNLVLGGILVDLINMGYLEGWSVWRW